MNGPRLAFIGLGVMGAPMAGHLARSGFPLTVYDLDRSKAEAVASEHEGVLIADGPSEAATYTDIVVTMLPSGEHVRDVALGPGGLIEGLRPGSLVLDTSSCEPWITVDTATVLRGAGIEMVDAPVSGARAGAEAAELVFMVGGTEQAVERVSPLFEVLGQRAFHLGSVGSGHAMKCINNLITALTLVATAEGLTIGARFGLDPAVMTDVLNASTGKSWISETHLRQRIINRAFDDPFKLALMAKDVGIALDLAARYDLPLPLSERGGELWAAAKHATDPDASISEIVRLLEKAADTEIR